MIASVLKKVSVPQIRLIISLMTIVAVIIIGVTVFVVTHLTGLNMIQGIVLISLGVIGLVIVMVILFLVMRNIRSRK
jgi:hypothetical protein